MTLSASRIVSFLGSVDCIRQPGAALGLILSGRTADHPGERTTLAFSGGAPADLPDVLEAATVDSLQPGSYRIASAGREWHVTAAASHLHRDIGADFYRALPPRPVPLKKRLFWRAVLALAARPWGLRLLLALRR